MTQIITADSYRENDKEIRQKIINAVDKNYHQLWRIAEEFKIVSPYESFSVKTRFGVFNFIPSLEQI